ncbi:MAG: hypothetical protein AAB633_02620 [Patescibacteria group bacterium]
MGIRRWWKTVVHGSRAPAVAAKSEPTVLPLRFWGARRVIVALEPPVQGRDSLILQTRFHCGTALSFAQTFYQDVQKALSNPREWARLEDEIRAYTAGRGYVGTLFVFFVTTDDVFLMACMRQNRLLMQYVIEPALRQVARMQMGQGAGADTLVALVNPDDFARIFKPSGPTPMRAVVPV